MEEGILQEICVKMNLEEKVTFNYYIMIDCDVDCVENLKEKDIISCYLMQEEIESSVDESMADCRSIG